MKMKIFNYILGACILSIAVASCEKAPLRNTEVIIPSDKTFVRFAMFSPGTPSVALKANDIKLNGLTPGNIGFFPSTVGFPDYVAVPVNSTLKISLQNSGTQNDSVVVFSEKLNMAIGKFYSYTLADTGINRTAFIYEDQFLPQQDSILSIRLINAMVGTGLHLIRIDSISATNVVRDTLAKNIPYKGSSGFIPVRVFGKDPVSSFVRIRIVSATTGRNFLAAGRATADQHQGQIQPQALATGSRRSITYYGYGFENGTGIYAPGLSPHITNQ
jgi:hypothetical protein